MMADWFKKEAHAFLGAVFVNSDMPDKVVSLDDEHRSGFACHGIGCNMTFPLHSARKRLDEITVFSTSFSSSTHNLATGLT